MSMTSPQQKAAAETSAWQAALSQQLAGVALPELQQLLGGRTWVQDAAATEPVLDEYGAVVTPGTAAKGHWETTQGSLTSLLALTQGGAVPSTMDAAAYQSALSQLNRAYGQQGRSMAEAAGYQGLRSGEARRSPGAVSSMISDAATMLERDRMQALANLQFTSAQTSLADYNKLLQLMGQGTQTALGLAGGFGATSSAALGGLSQVSPGQAALGGAATGGALGGAIAGAGWGTAAGPYGALIGAGVGAIAGGLAGSG